VVVVAYDNTGVVVVVDWSGLVARAERETQGADTKISRSFKNSILIYFNVKCGGFKSSRVVIKFQLSFFNL
jgi:hypothetical protein